jgi:hypothetical protein
VTHEINRKYQSPTVCEGHNGAFEGVDLETEAGGDEEIDESDG